MINTAIDKVYLGRCVFRNDRFTRLEPLAEASPGGWQEIENKARRFPPSGLVFSVDKNTLGVAEGTIREFRIQPNVRGATKLKDEHDQYIVAEAREPVEIVDFTNIELEAARRILVEDGLSHEQASSLEVVVALKGDRCVRLALQNDVSATRKPQRFNGLEVLTTFHFPRSQLTCPIEGRHFLCPVFQLRPVGIVEWSTNADFFQRIIRRLRRIDEFQSLGGFDISRKAVERLMTALRSGEALGADPVETYAITERLKPFLSNLQVNLEFAEELVAELMGSTEVKELISSRVDDRIESTIASKRIELEAKIRADLNLALSEESATLARMQEESRLLAVENQRKRDELEETRAAAEKQRNEIVAAGEGFISTVANILERTDRYSAKMRRGDSVSFSTRSAKGARKIGRADLRQALADKSKSLGFDGSQLLELDALLRAGEMPLLFGHDAPLLLSAYSDVASGGSISRVYVDPATIGVDDLWRAAGTGELTELAKAWIQASSMPDLVLLLAIEEIQNAPVANWLPQFMTFLAENKPPNLLVCASYSAWRNIDDPASCRAILKMIPVEAVASKAAVAAVVSRAAEGMLENVVTQLEGDLDAKFPSELAASFAASILKFCEMSSVAHRTVRIFRSLLVTHELTEAQNLAFEYARYMVKPAVPQKPQTSFERSIMGLSTFIQFDS